LCKKEDIFNNDRGEWFKEYEVYGSWRGYVKALEGGGKQVGGQWMPFAGNCGKKYAVECGNRETRGRKGY
jgi:hypothetical protein